MSKHDPRLLADLIPYGTERQQEVLSIWIEEGSAQAAAKRLGISERAIVYMKAGAQKRAISQGWAPEYNQRQVVPPGYHVRGVSTLYNAEGEVSQQWVKSAKDHVDRWDQLLEAIEGIRGDLEGVAAPTSSPSRRNEDLLCVYPMGDPHVGMLSWEKETGDNFDLEIAERNLIGAVDQLVSLAPPAKEALIVNLGDFFHADNADNKTRRSGNVLDVDGRWPKVLAIALRCMRRCVDLALRVHETVYLICEIGNHDDMSAIMLALCMEAYYANEPRVRVDTSPSPFHYFRFGENLIGVTHGHRVKARDLPGIMAADRKEDWGETSFRYWYCGHVHHDSLREYAGATVETFRTLAPRDAWHHGQGYRSDRDMKLDVLHRKYGRINRHIVGIRQIVEEASA